MSDLIAVEATDISRPFDNVPLNTIECGNVVMMLLKSSHAASSSARCSFGTPEKYQKWITMLLVVTEYISKVNTLEVHRSIHSIIGDK